MKGPLVAPLAGWSRSPPPAWQLIYAIAIGLVLRLALAFALGNTPGGRRLGDDYVLFGQQLLTAGWDYNDPVRPPLPTLFSALMNALVGAHAELAIVAFQLVLAVAAIVAVYAIARRFLAHEPALLAAALVAVDPLLVMYGVTVSSDAVYVPVAAVTLAIFFRGRSCSRPILLAFALGAALAVAQYTRATGFVFLASLWAATLLARTISIRQMAIASAVMAAACLPWIARNGIKYGEYAFSSSGDYNIAAIYIGHARARAEPDLARRVRAGNNLNIWSAELRPRAPDESDFAYARRAKAVALHWAYTHKAAVLANYGRGLARRWLSPGETRYNIALRGVDGNSVALAIPLALWRLLYGASALVGFFICWRCGGAARQAAIALGSIFTVNYLAMGPGTDARYFLAEAMTLAPLAAAGVYAVWRRARRRSGVGVARETRVGP